MSHILLFIIKLYKKFLSPLIPPSCRYYPTCSTYAIEAIQEWGALKGTYLAIVRILKCNPLFPGGIDNVPKNECKNHKH
jgi:putative membrane protein insertion efficiency factor